MPKPHHIAAALCAAGLMSANGFAFPAGDVVISQIYGGNGNAYKSDYVELFNRSASPINVTGWSVQYASAAGTGHFSANGVAAEAVCMALKQEGDQAVRRLQDLHRSIPA